MSDDELDNIAEEAESERTTMPVDAIDPDSESRDVEASAQAEDPEDVCTLGVICGSVTNLTNNQIRIRGDVSGGEIVERTLSPGQHSFSVMRDVDQFTFPGTGFRVGITHYNRGQWYRIHNGFNADCTKIPPFEPVCIVHAGI